MIAVQPNDYLSEQAEHSEYSTQFFDENGTGPDFTLCTEDTIVSALQVAVFPKNIDYPPRELGERVYNLQRWTEMPRGGHFPALEEPDLPAEDLRAFFRPLRTSGARCQ